VLVGWTNPVDKGAKAVNRTGGDLKESDAQAGLRDYFATDGRSGEATTSDMQITLGALPAGKYSWTSYHHDMKSMSDGVIDITVADATGSAISVGAVTVSDHGTAGGSYLADVASFTTTFEANGNDNVVLTFRNQNQYAGTPDLDGFFVINGFTVDAIPEPATLSLMGAFAGVVLFVRRRFLI
jgi:hypothetical protein